MASGTWTYTKRWDTGLGGIGGAIQHPTPHNTCLLFEQTLTGGRGDNNNTGQRFNDADTGVAIPKGTRRLILVCRLDTAPGGAATDILNFGIDVKTPLSSRFHNGITRRATAPDDFATFLGTLAGGDIPYVQILQMSANLSQGGGSRLGSKFALNTAETGASGLVDGKEGGHGISMDVFTHCRAAWGFTHGATAGGTFAATVQMYAGFY